MDIASNGYESANVLVISETRSSEKWVLDLGCTFHITPNRSLFTTFQELDAARVLMGNNASCQVKEIDNVKLMLHDRTTKKLADVRFIPESKRNLISLGTLDAHGFSFKAMNGILKIMKGSLMIMKVEIKNGLYILQGNSYSGLAVVTSPKIKDHSSPWHRRLAHVSEKGLAKLGKRGLLCGDKIYKTEFCDHCIYGKISRVKFGIREHF